MPATNTTSEPGKSARAKSARRRIFFGDAPACPGGLSHGDQALGGNARRSARVLTNRCPIPSPSSCVSADTSLAAGRRLTARGSRRPRPERSGGGAEVGFVFVDFGLDGKIGLEDPYKPRGVIGPKISTELLRPKAGVLKHEFVPIVPVELRDQY